MKKSKFFIEEFFTATKNEMLLQMYYFFRVQ